MAILGQDIIVYHDGTAIAGAKTDDIIASCNLMETSSPSTGSWRTFLAGRKEWELTTTYLVSQMMDLLSVGSSYTITIRDRNDRYNVVSGTAIMETCKITAAHGSLLRGSFKFRGTGAIT